VAWWKKRGRLTKAELVERKHQLEGEINVVAAELKRRRGRGEPTGDLETRLDGLWSRHYQTRLEIDRTDPNH
jgi:hypothetical protein